MRSLKILALAAAAMAALATSHARAADLPPLLPPPPPIADYGGWYLRGDLGFSKQRSSGIFHPQMNAPAVFEWLDSGRFDSAPIFGLGLGYRHNSWFRWDATAEFRAKAEFSALDRYDDTGDGTFEGTNEWRFKKSEYLLMLNGYVDLGTWRGITPFIGAGIGASRNSISHLRDLNVPNSTVAYAQADAKWDLAWAIHAGFSYNITPNVAIEFAYRYLDMGDAQSGILRDFAGGCTLCQPVQVRDLTSHDLKVGVRMALADMGWSPPPPLISKYGSRIGFRTNGADLVRAVCISGPR
jgi:opacity protein-like surface antigen